MIPEYYVEKWKNQSNWQSKLQVEQDLIISRALIDLYQNEIIKRSLLFRGGTALNKLFLNPPARYSEDLDFVQKNNEPIGETIDAVRDVLSPWLGEPKRKITERSAKIVFKYQSVTNITAKLKIEINTTEHFQVLPLRHEIFSINSDWFSGHETIPTYELDELMGTKLRALYQRRKGRDLFDIWYVVKKDLVDVEKIIEIFNKYCAYNNTKISREEFLKSLELKKYTGILEEICQFYFHYI